VGRTIAYLIAFQEERGRGTRGCGTPSVAEQFFGNRLVIKEGVAPFVERYSFRK